MKIVKGIGALLASMVLLGCSSTADNVPGNNFEDTLNDSSPLLKLGMNSGVYQGFVRFGEEFRILRVAENGQHAFYELKLAWGLTSYKRYQFTDSDIRCNAFQCVISKDSKTQFYIQHANAGFQAVEVSLDESGDVILAEPFELDIRRTGSAAKAFTYFYQNEIRQALSAGPEVQFGEGRSLWLGVSEGNYYSTLHSLMFEADGSVKWRRYADVESDNLKLYNFSAEEVAKVNNGYKLRLQDGSSIYELLLFGQWRGDLNGTITEFKSDGSVAKVTKVEFLKINPFLPRRVLRQRP